MTEAEWLACGMSDPMLAFLRGRPGLGRKRRLLAAACCRRVWQWMPAACRPTVELAERLAEETVSEEERWAVFAAAGEAHDSADLPDAWAGYCAYRAVERPSDYDEPTLWDDDPAAWVAQTAAQPAAWINHQWDSALLAAERMVIANLIRDIFGNPFRPARISSAALTWKDSIVVRLAQTVYEERHLPEGALDRGRLAVLADALEEAGCTDADMLGHLRGPDPHVRGCWVVDLCLGKS
jgi:hypothetical protein